ncbi:DUF4920 domain-containing protein [Myroides injenensis]|uniref:DUF4920 domain-containing protein n=1 Tax=Myroides injenensis TaxID=1183151 RepID=UPI0002898943|nr:DUF4920 domain-containing protein [Myroides injenensis]
MKKVVGLFCLSMLVLVGCKNSNKNKSSDLVYEEENYEFFGDNITLDKVVSKEEAWSHYKDLKVGDTIVIKFVSNIDKVCQKKGCWVTLELDDSQKSFVKFKDYAFFAPMNASGHEAIVNGKAFVSEISVDELKHYAKDAGKTEEEIALITESKKTYGFMADGIAIKKDATHEG